MRRLRLNETPTHWPLGFDPERHGAVNGIKLTWTDHNSPLLASFEVWRKKPGTDWILLWTVSPVTAVTDYSATPGVVYTYRLRAIRFGLYSGWSNEASAMMGTSP